MSDIRVLNDDDVRSILDLKNTIVIVENVFKMKANKKAKLFPIVSEEIVKGQSEMDIKSGMLIGSQVFGLKLVSWFGNNKIHNLPTTIGLAMLFDLKYGLPKALINARYLTSMRTGVAGAIGVKYLAKKDSKSLLMVGTGNQAIFQIAATLSEIESINKVYIYNPLRYERAINFQKLIKNELSKIVRDIDDPDNIEWNRRIDEVEFVALSEIENSLNDIDVIITATPSHKALILDKTVNSGVHFSCMGADVAGKQEIDESIFKRAIIYTDDINQAISVGETQKAFEAGIIAKTDIQEIGNLILEGRSGRTSDNNITIFDSTGIALQDLAVSKYLLEKAEELNIGTIIDI